jgi:Protein of unknown function (DUF3810)
VTGPARSRTIAPAAAIAGAVVAAILPVSPSWIERGYSTSFYIFLQQWLTPISNAVPVSLFDIASAVLLAAILSHILRAFRHRTEGWLRAIGRLCFDAAAAAATVYLLFLFLWGLNYRRAPVTSRLDHDRSRVTGAEVERIAIDAARRLNDLHPIAHRSPWADLSELPARMAAPFADAQRAIGMDRLAAIGRPKRTLFDWYFRRAAIDGMTDPFFLEVLLNREILPFERPAVLAHEWAHLAGFAHEAEAGFLGWLTTTFGDEQAQYSGWLTVFGYAAGSLDDGSRDRVVKSLSPGVREDLRAISRRLRSSAPEIRALAMAAYDRFLRANRVESGVRSYDELITIIAGTRFDARGRPVRALMAPP